MRLKALWARCVLLAAVLTLAGCSVSSDSCDDLEGTLTHTITEITGIESVSVLQRVNALSGEEVLESFNEGAFSDLIIDVQLAWIEEQHRFRAPNTFIQSLFDGFIKPVGACTLAPYYEYYAPGVASIEIFSDNDLNADFLAGSRLASAFQASGAMGENQSLSEAVDNGGLLSARAYSLVPVWLLEGGLVTIPETPRTHAFTVSVTLDDGRVFEMRTPEVLVTVL